MAALAEIMITIPEADKERVLSPFAALYGYDAQIHGSLEDFVKGKVIDWIKSTAIDYEARPAAVAARQTISQEINAIEIN